MKQMYRVGLRWRFFAVALPFLLWSAPAAQACETIQQVWIAPSEVRVFVDKSKMVATAIACTADSDSTGAVNFQVRLVDSDLIDEHPSEDSEDDVLSTKVISGMVEATNALVPVLAAAVHSIRCPEPSPSNPTMIIGEADSFEGQESTTPAELGVSTSTSTVQFPQSGFVPAYCVPSLREDDVEELLVLTGVNLVDIDFDPPAPMFDDGFPAEVSYDVTEGEAHLQFVLGDEGEMPPMLDVHILAQGGLSEEGSKQLEEVRTIHITGADPFVEVEGLIQPDGTFDASGSGVVAGFPDIDVQMVGALRGGKLEAAYGMGVDGDLPGGFPLVFDVSGSVTPVEEYFQAMAAGIEEAAQQLALFNAPFPIGDVDFEDMTIRTAANLLVAQAALLQPQPDPDPTRLALRGIQAQLLEFADEAAASELIGRFATEQAARDAGAAFGTAADLREEMNELLAAAPGAELTANMAAWADSLDALVSALNGVGAAAHGNSFVTVLGGSFSRVAAAPESIVSGFGQTGVPMDAATMIPLPIELGGASIQIVDAEGSEFTAELLVSSPGQFNYLVPSGVAEGLGTATVYSGDETLATGFLAVRPVAPSIFTANSDGEGAPAANIIQIASDGSRTFAEAFTAGALGERQPALIDLSDPDTTYFLSLFGTGFRRASEVVVTIDGVKVEGVAFAESAEFEGLDQANVPLSPALAGMGVVEVVLIADGVVANTVLINL